MVCRNNYSYDEHESQSDARNCSTSRLGNNLDRDNGLQFQWNFYSRNSSISKPDFLYTSSDHCGGPGCYQRDREHWQHHNCMACSRHSNAELFSGGIGSISDYILCSGFLCKRNLDNRHSRLFMGRNFLRHECHLSNAISVSAVWAERIDDCHWNCNTIWAGSSGVSFDARELSDARGSGSQT